MKKTCIVLATFAALWALVGATAMAQTPAENAKAVMGELTEVNDSLLFDYWASVTVNKVKLGYAHIVSEKTTDEKGSLGYKITLTMVIQTASGMVTVSEKAFLSPSFRMTSRIWGTQGAMHGFGEILHGCNHAFAWTDGQVKITRTEKDKKVEKVTVLSTPQGTLSQVGFLFPLLMKKGPAKYAFSELDIDDDKVKGVSETQVEVFAAKEMEIKGKPIEAVEVRKGDESMFFSKDGTFLMRRDGPLQIIAAPSKEQAVAGLVPFDLEGDTDWTLVTKPVDIVKAFFYAMIKKDSALFGKIFNFRRFFKSMLEGQGQPVDDETLDGMVAMYKPRMIEQMFKNGDSMKPYYLLIVPSATTVKMLSDDKAALTMQDMKLTIEKIKGAWMIVKM
jgi:hypothetical protein